MTLRIVRLGNPRHPHEGLRIGTVRRPPRGVKKTDYAKKNLYDVWFPNLAPSEVLLKEFFPVTDAEDWQRFRRAYLKEMKQAEARADIGLLAALSKTTNLSVGCYCEDETRCHRSLLRELLEAAGADLS